MCEIWTTEHLTKHQRLETLLNLWKLLLHKLKENISFSIRKLKFAPKFMTCFLAVSLPFKVLLIPYLSQAAVTSLLSPTITTIHNTMAATETKTKKIHIRLSLLTLQLFPIVAICCEAMRGMSLAADQILPLAWTSGSLTAVPPKEDWEKLSASGLPALLQNFKEK